MIDAVRVRAKAPGSWKQAQPEVEKLANEIRDMGLQATVVAGSAREDTNIFVPGYSKDDAGKESPLGTVQQSWVSQDAADAVTGSLSGHQPDPALPDSLRCGPADRRVHRQLRPQAAQ